MGFKNLFYALMVSYFFFFCYALVVSNVCCFIYLVSSFACLLYVGAILYVCFVFVICWFNLTNSVLLCIRPN